MEAVGSIENPLADWRAIPSKMLLLMTILFYIQLIVE